MKKNKRFVGISFTVKDNAVTSLCASSGKMLFDKNGIDAKRALDFLFSLHLRARGERQVLCAYGFSYALEHIFAALPMAVKDKLFQSARVRNNLTALKDELEDIEDALYIDQDEALSFDKEVTEAAIEHLTKVEFEGYAIEVHLGKTLAISKGRRRVIIYDVFSFFRKPLDQAWLAWFNKPIPKDGVNVLATAAAIARIASAVDTALIEQGIDLSSFHGAGAIATWMLKVGGAKDKANPQYHSYAKRRQLSAELHGVVNKAYYAGRIEQLQVGTMRDVYVSDINSAYAYATAMLPYLLRRPSRLREWKAEPFSVWLCDYDFRSLGLPFSLLPFRSARGNILYKLAGRGYYWQPEVAYILEHYPQCIDVIGGYYIPYERAAFTQVVEAIYDIRKAVKGSPLSKILKVALASIYGKFCQEDGYFFNRMYAGFITSVTRRQLLEATRDNEDAVICFLTDAIHSTKPLTVTVGDELGQYKQENYIKGEYIDNGIYRLTRSDETQKIAAQGFRSFDFDTAFAQFNKSRGFDALVEFFVGYNLYSLMPLTRGRYLQLYSENQHHNPLSRGARTWTAGGDLTKTRLVSQPRLLTAVRESAEYRAQYVDMKLGLDALRAGVI